MIRVPCYRGQIKTWKMGELPIEGYNEKEYLFVSDCPEGSPSGFTVLTDFDQERNEYAPQWVGGDAMNATARRKIHLQKGWRSCEDKQRCIREKFEPTYIITHPVDEEHSHINRYFASYVTQYVTPPKSEAEKRQNIAKNFSGVLGKQGSEIGDENFI